MSRPGPDEQQVQAAIVQTALVLGWRVSHFRAARTGKGYRTPVEGHVGFPDLVLARAGVVFAWELKGAGGRPTVEQRAWLAELAGGVADARVVGPDELDDAIRALELGYWPT